MSASFYWPGMTYNVSADHTLDASYQKSLSLQNLSTAHHATTNGDSLRQQPLQKVYLYFSFLAVTFRNILYNSSSTVMRAVKTSCNDALDQTSRTFRTPSRLGKFLFSLLLCITHFFRLSSEGN